MNVNFFSPEKTEDMPCGSSSGSSSGSSGSSSPDDDEKKKRFYRRLLIVCTAAMLLCGAGVLVYYNWESIYNYFFPPSGGGGSVGGVSTFEQIISRFDLSNVSYILGDRHVPAADIRSLYTTFESTLDHSQSESRMFTAILNVVLQVIPTGTDISSFVSPISGEVIEASRVVTLHSVSDINGTVFATLGDWLLMADWSGVTRSPQLDSFLSVANDFFHTWPTLVGGTFVFTHADVAQLIEVLRYLSAFV